MLQFIKEDAKSIITPEEAKELIARYEASEFKNRVPYKATLNLYVSELLESKWILNGETIKVTKDLIPIDGLNRLTAIVESGKPMECFVIQLDGNIDEIVSTIDIGRKRSVENALEFQGEMYERGAMSIVRYHKVLQKGGSCIGQSDANNGFTRQWLIEQYRNMKYEYCEAARFAKGICKKTRMKTVDVGGIYMHLIYDLGWDSDVVEEFFNRLRSVNLTTDVGFFRSTRKNLEETDIRSAERTEIYMRCWNSWRNGNRTRLSNLSDHFFTPSESKKKAA